MKTGIRLITAGNRVLGILAIGYFLSGCGSGVQEKSARGSLYSFDDNQETHWSSPENRNGQISRGAMENKGAKGHAFDHLPAGGSDTLLQTEGPGIIQRIWITVSDRSPEMLRSLRIDMYWDGEKKPAVSVPLGDFFGMGLGHTAKFQNVFFSDAEGRAFVCLIPMPFRKSARIVVSNESAQPLSHIFFDVDYSTLKSWDDSYLYFHAFWHRNPATTPGMDFELLPQVHGRGRYLGANVGINANPVYGHSWWGEGEVKMYLDEDRQYPTLAGTGTEDYIGTGWGQGEFAHTYSGCLLADDSLLQWCFYRYHVPDPVFFRTGCRVTLQQIGGQMKSVVMKMQQAGLPLIPVSIDTTGRNPGFLKLYERDTATRLSNPLLPEGWTNYYRSDDLSATAYFYLDNPVDDLPALQPPAVRIFRLH